MAIDYDSGTGIFNDIGKPIKHINLLDDDASNLDTDRDEIQDQFESSDKTEYTTGIIGEFDSLKSAHYSLRGKLAARVAQRLRDRVTVIDELNLDRDQIGEVLDALVTQMGLDSESVDGSVVTLGSPTAGAGNTGNGTVLVNKVRDGVSAPGQGMRPHKDMNGVDSELCVDETVTLEVTQDSYGSGGVTEGEERLRVYGEKRRGGKSFVEPEGGTGPGPVFGTVMQQNLLSGGTMETFASNVPSGWTVDNGTAGTHILQETTEFYRGSSSVEFKGDGAEAVIQIGQAPTLTRLTPTKRYLVGLRYKSKAVELVGQTLTVQFEGTGYTAGGTEKVSITGDNFSTTWASETFYINLPQVIPSDFRLVIEVGGTPDAAFEMYFDDVFVAPVVWHGGFNIAVIPGSTPFVKNNDIWTVAVSNSKAGTFQEFFRRYFGTQLVSNTAGTETILDTLAE